MLQLGFSEVLLTSVVALLVLRPEKFPELTSTAGRVLATLRRLLYNLQQDFSLLEEPRKKTDSSSLRSNTSTHRYDQ